MARFLSVAELLALKGQERVSRLSSDAGEQASAVASAEGEVLSHLTSRYADAELPSSPETTPALLKHRVADLALYFLATANSDQVAEPLRLAYTDAIAWLRRVAGGGANLNLAATPAVDLTVPQVLATRGENDMVFGAGGLDDW